MATWKTGYRGDVVTLLVTFDQNVELLLHCCNILQADLTLSRSLDAPPISHTNPKRQRWNRRQNPRRRFGLVCYPVVETFPCPGSRASSSSKCAPALMPRWKSARQN